MNDFYLVNADTSGGFTPPKHEVAVAIGQSGRLNWTDAQVMGHACITTTEWNEMIDRLIKSLEQVRSEGHAKLRENKQPAK
jgi:hypothetical protein